MAQPPRVLLESDRLLFCGVRKDDADDHFRWINLPEVVRTLPVPGPISRDQSDAILDQLIALPPEQGLRFALWTRDPLRHIGGIGLHQIHPRDQHATAVLYVGEKDHWGQGYAREAGQRLLEHAFETLGLRKVWMNHIHDNDRIRRVVEALGFVEVGRQRAHCFVDGRWVDWVTMELFNPRLAGPVSAGGPAK